MSKIFFDTNILIYTLDQRDPLKYSRAREAFTYCMKEGIGIISTQVLHEYASTALTKFHQTHEHVVLELLSLEKFEIVPATPKLVRSGVKLAGQFKLNFWDAAILAAAEQSQCDQLYSEDFPAGAVYNKLRVVNPLV
ncbi:MAG: PIN domain-containing protein [Thermoguttaceae bacterium]|jgi:predicted nucleic acid-binding protein